MHLTLISKPNPNNSIAWDEFVLRHLKWQGSI
jgi:hypothetical protein